MPEIAVPHDALDASLDASHATPDLVQLVTSTLADKTSRDVGRTMQHFSRDQLTYTDTTVGDTYRDWSALKGAFERFMTMWGDGTRCYPTRIVGDARSAMVIFVDSPEMFRSSVNRLTPCCGKPPPRSAKPSRVATVAQQPSSSRRTPSSKT